jgi:DNA-binding response OmpR family regulator
VSEPTERATPVVLVVTGEASLAESIRYLLELDGVSVVASADPRWALRTLPGTAPALAIIDERVASGAILWPALADASVEHLLLAEGGELPVWFSTNGGGDADVLTAPFEMERLREVVRDRLGLGNSHGLPPREVLRAGALLLDVGGHQAWLLDRLVPLTPKEFVLLEAFLRNEGKLLSRSFLMNVAWGPGCVGQTNTLEVHVRRLRRKLHLGQDRQVTLATVRRRGYRLVAEGSGRHAAGRGFSGRKETLPVDALEQPSVAVLGHDLAGSRDGHPA